MKPGVRSNRWITVSFAIPKEVGSALRSAVEEISYIIGQRLEGRYSFAREQALTDAAEALGPLRAAVNAVVPEENPNYE